MTRQYKFLARLEWFCLCMALVCVVLVYPLELQGRPLSWFERLADVLPWLASLLEPYVSFRVAPLELKGLISGFFLLVFATAWGARQLWLGRRPRWEPHGWLWGSCLAFFGWMGITALWSPTPVLVPWVLYFVALFGGVLAVLLARGIGEREMKWLAVLMLALGMAVMGILFLQALPVFGGKIYQILHRFEDKRNVFGSLMGHNSAASSYLLMTSFLALAFILTARRRIWRVVNVLYLLGAVVGMLLLQSRAIWVFAPVLGLGALWSVMRGRRTAWGRWLPTLILATLALAVLTQAIDRPWNPFYVKRNSLARRLQDITPSALLDESRLRMNVIGATLVPERPLFGHGLYAYQYVFPKRQGEYFSTHPGSALNRTVFRSNMAHNEYIQVLIDQGAVGLGLLLWLLGAIAWSGRRVQRGLTGRTALLHSMMGWAGLAFCLHGLVDFPFHIPQLAVPGMLCLAAWAHLKTGALPEETPQGAAAQEPQPAMPQADAPHSALAFRPRVFVRLLGGMFVLGLVPLACLPLLFFHLADLSYQRGMLAMQLSIQASATDEKIHYARQSIQAFKEGQGLCPGYLLTYHMVPESYMNLGSIYARASREQPSYRADAMQACQVALQEVDRGLKVLDYHLMYNMKAKIFQIMKWLEPGQRQWTQGYYEQLQMTLRYCPHYAPAAMELADLLESQPKADMQRVHALRQVAYLSDPKGFDGRYATELVDQTMVEKNYERAMAGWQRLLTFDAKNLKWLNYLGLCYMQLGQRVQALECFLKIKQLDPRFYIDEVGADMSVAALQGDWAALQEILGRFLIQGNLEERAWLRNIEIELARRLGRENEPVTFTRPAQVDEQRWNLVLEETRPYVLRVYFAQTEQAAQLICKHLDASGEPMDLFPPSYWIEGVYTGLELGDLDLARRALERLEKLEPRARIVSDFKHKLGENEDSAPVGGYNSR